MEMFDVVVVGAGWCGLITAKTFLQLAPNTKLLILDNGYSIGGTWAKEKLYPGLYAQASHGKFEYACYPMPNKGISADGYIPGETINEYLNQFARDHDLVQQTRLQTTVVHVDRGLDGVGWRLTIKDQPDILCQKLIYATGPTSSATMPSWPTDGFSQPIIHSQTLGRNLEHINNPQRKRFLVVGTGKSALDTAFVLARAGKKIDLLCRDSDSGPLAIAAPTVFWLWNLIDYASTRLVASFSPSLMPSPTKFDWFLQSTWLGRMIMIFYWFIFSKWCAFQAGYGKNSNLARLHPKPRNSFMFWGRGGVGVASAPDYWKVLQSADLTVHQTEIEGCSDSNIVTLRDKTSIQTDMIILCTGYDKGYRAFSLQLQSELGLYSDSNEQARWVQLDKESEDRIDHLFPILKNSPSPPVRLSPGHAYHPNRHYRRLIIPSLAAQGDRSILFPGQHDSIWTPLVCEVQAIWGAAFMLGWLDVPDQLEMKHEVALFNAWTRKRYLEQGQRRAYILYDPLSYIDTLMGDLQLNPRRKRTWWAEWFSPYSPKDYRNLVGEYKSFKLERMTAKNLG